jgi:hypothetical protein
VAFANGVAWSVIVPPFQVPDENAHYAYVAQIAENGTLPHPQSPEPLLPPREEYLANALLTFGIVYHAENPAPLANSQQQAIEHVEAEKLSAKGTGTALTATNNPPLYYGLEAIAYKLTPSGSVLDKLAAMRVLSALFGACTVLLVFMFLSELLPGTPWAWPVGALLVAFQPLFGFMSGGVNNDDLLFLAAAGMFWGIARAFRRGLDARTGALLGGFVGVGLVAKLNMLGFVPAVVLAVALLVLRELPRPGRALRGAAVAALLGGGPVLLYVLLNHFAWGRGYFPGGVASVATAPSGRRFSTAEELSHVWQLFLPRLWMRPQFTSYPLWSTWFVGLVGRFGWQDYTFPYWVYQLARVIALAVLALACVEFVRRRAAMRRRLGELCVYVVVVAGLCLEIGIESYRYLFTTGETFEQARYLLPLLPLYAGIAVLAARVGGRRWGPACGAALVMLAIGHDLYAQAITVARYYS